MAVNTIDKLQSYAECQYQNTENISKKIIK